MKRYLIVALVGFALAGASCDQGKITPAETVLLGCGSFSSALVVVTQLNDEGKLNPQHVAIVDHARGGANPICLGQAPNVDASVKDIVVDGAARSLLSIAASFGR